MVKQSDRIGLYHILQGNEKMINAKVTCFTFSLNFNLLIT